MCGRGRLVFSRGTRGRGTLPSDAVHSSGEIPAVWGEDEAIEVGGVNRGLFAADGGGGPPMTSERFGAGSGAFRTPAGCGPRWCPMSGVTGVPTLLLVGPMPARDGRNTRGRGVLAITN